jgi:hypothetical protein
MKYTYLKTGDVLQPRNDVISYLHSLYAHKHNLFIGLTVQSEHSLQLDSRGYIFEAYEDTHPLDRTIITPTGEKIMMDDKVALYNYNKGKPAVTWTIGRTEWPEWNKIVMKGGDVFITAFEQFDPKNPWQFKFCGIYQYSRLIIKPSEFNDTKCFHRADNKHALVERSYD